MDVIVHLNKKYVVVGNAVFPIVSMFDCFGEYTDNPDECVALTAGQGHYWLSIAVEPANEILH